MCLDYQAQTVIDTQFKMNKKFFKYKRTDICQAIILLQKYVINFYLYFKSLSAKMALKDCMSYIINYLKYHK